ncbi:MAG: ribosome silencing factor [Bacteriovoracaceae bacterium]|nr:ribosome silencing factor [Bacteriovoracaceae bacterium]
MSQTYIQNEVDKIIEERSFQTPLNYAMAAAWIIANFKGINIKIYDVSQSSALSDYYVIGTATNPIQGRAAVDEILVNLKRHGQMAISKEGMDSTDWVLLDLGDVMVHILQEHSRDIYDLDSLWRQYEQVEIPHDFYFSHPEAGKKPNNNNDDSNDYF